MRGLLLLVLCLPIVAHAFDKSYPVTCTTTVAIASVQTAINSASAGDVVCMQAGSGSPTISIPGGKDITVAGAAAWGGGTTTLTGGSFSMTKSGANIAGSRITGVTITHSNENDIIGIQGFRFDHSTITRATWSFTIFGIGSDDGSHTSNTKVTGLIDHVTCTNCRMVSYGEYSISGASGGGGRTRWSEDETFGDGNCIYIEDSTFTIPVDEFHNAADGNVGGCYVFRFNGGTNTYTEMHSVQGQSTRGIRRWEVYGNSITLNMTGSSVFSRPISIIGGSGVAWGNVWTRGNEHWHQETMNMDNVRTYDNTRWDGYCGLGPGNNGDGTAVIDENTAGQSGYLCRDQPGAGKDAFLWTMSGNDYSESPISNIPSQTHVPMYFWSNTIDDSGGTPHEAVVFRDTSNEPEYLQFEPNKTYYQKSGASCTGGGSCTTGVGVGTTLPTTCTTGVGFWKSDAGSWNESTTNPQGVQQNGADGVLYKCTSTNTWTVYYTPYTYPHPLQGVSASSSQRVIILLRNIAWMAVSLAILGGLYAFRVKRSFSWARANASALSDRLREAGNPAFA